MLRVINESSETIGYKCSECLGDVIVCDTVCESCGRELVYPYFMPSTIWWERHTLEEREVARKNALDITIALVVQRGTDWRDLRAPFNRFLGGEHADRYVAENVGEVIVEEIDERMRSRERKASDLFKKERVIRLDVKDEIKKEKEDLLREQTLWQPKEEYPYASKFFTLEDIKRLEEELPPTLVHEEYLS